MESEAPKLEFHCLIQLLQLSRLSQSRLFLFTEQHFHLSFASEPAVYQIYILL